MGMTIDEAKQNIETYAISEAEELPIPVVKSFDMAINVMRKYQKIEQTLKDILYGGEVIESQEKSETLVSPGVYKQVAWERDIAIQQLHELGYEFGEKIEPTTKNDKVDCKHTDCNNCVNHKYCDYEPTTKNDLGVEHLISREDVLRTIFYKSDNNCDVVLSTDLMDRINKIPSVTPQEPRWIPVSERLPERSGEYLVSVIDDEDEDYKHVGVAYFAHPNDYDIDKGEWRELMIDEKVIAWMPLPHHYEPQESEDT